MKSQKGIIHLGLILVLLVIGIGALVFVMYKTNSLPVVTTSSPSPSSTSEPMMEENETNGWKTYTNARYGYTFKYPSEFILQGQDADAKGVVTEETRNLAVFDPRYRDYKDRILDIQHFDLMTPPTPNWNDMIVNIGNLQVTKFTNNSPEIQFDIYQIAQANGGLEIMAQKAIQTEIVSQILFTFEFVRQDNSRTTWKTYTDPTYNFTINYPASYSVSGQLAANLQDWKAAKGITISSPNNPAKPEVFIEAVFDGYGPIFPTGNINASFSGNKLVVSLDKKDDQEYKQMVDNGLVLSGNELYLSKIIHHGDIPFWFQIKHKDRGNAELDNELKEILSTFQFNK